MIQSKNITNPLNIAICTNQAVGAAADVVLSYNTTNPEKNLLDERDEIVFNIKSLLNNIPAGSTITATFYGSEAFGVIGTETITLPEITKDLVPAAYYGFYSEYSKRAKYFTLAITLKKGTAYTASIECLLKKKIVKEPLFNQPAPTTATTGTIGDIIVDTNGDSHTLIRIEGGLYYWSSPKLKRMPFFMNAGLFDFSAKNLKNRKWYFPDGTTSTAERPAVTLTRAGVVELEGDWDNSYQVLIDRNATTTLFIGRLKDLYLAGYYLVLYGCTQMTGSLADTPRVSHTINLGACPQVTGALLDMARVSSTINAYNLTQITGSLADAPRVSYYLDLGNCALITGSLIDAPRVSYYLRLSSCPLIVGSLPLTTIATYVNIGNTGSSKAEVDTSIANLVAGHPSMSGAKTLILTGLKRTSASSAGVATLITRGWAITDATIED